MKLVVGILIGWAIASLLLLAALCWRALTEALGDIDTIEPDPMFVANLIDFPLWETELAKEDK